MRARRFCSACGRPNQPWRGTAHRECPKCGAMDWLNPAPAVGIAFVDEAGRVLLSKRARPPKAGGWDLVGGFVDAGETPAAAARRETLEETGCSARQLRLRAVLPGDYDGQPTLNFVYTGRILGKPRAMDDSLELRWFAPTRLPKMAWPHEADVVRRVV